MGAGADNLSSALQGAGLNAIPSLDGGGWTGNGARTGGLDGKGGFLAVLHPQERVEDTTKTGSMRGGRGARESMGTRIIATHDPGILLQVIDERIGAAEQRQASAFTRNVQRAQAEIQERY